MPKVKLAEALLRRKELQEKVAQLRLIKEKDIFEMKVERIKVTESVDNIRAAVPILEANQVTAEYDFYAKKLRIIDSVIQQANWTCAVDVKDTMGDYVAKTTT